jgi:hypothetical protein
MEDAKMKFEKEREKVLSEIPATVKAMFGQIGFSTSDETGELVPLLVLNPYDVPPKPVRDVYWFDMFSKNKRSKKLKKMSYLVYWYGSVDPDDCYSFIEQMDFISYENGEKRDLGILPKSIQDKIDENLPLSEEEEWQVRAIKEMEEDLPKAPEERRRGNIGFKERHEMLGDAKDSDKKRKR